MFNFGHNPVENDFDIDFDAPNPSQAQKAKPKVTPSQMAEYIAAQKTDCVCPLCAKSPKPGWWWSYSQKQWSTCGRCGGSGTYTEEDRSRYNAYATRKMEGKPMDVDYKTHMKAVREAWAL